MSLADLIRVAYRVKPYQLSGPDWMTAERFDVLAKMPEGATREQVPEMLKALLAEPFKLAVHRESKEHAVYALVVGKGGPKLKESAPDADAPAGGDAPAAFDLHVSGRGENTQVSISSWANRHGAHVHGAERHLAWKLPRWTWRRWPTCSRAFSTARWWI